MRVEARTSTGGEGGANLVASHLQERGLAFLRSVVDGVPAALTDEAPSLLLLAATAAAHMPRPAADRLCWDPLGAWRRWRRLPGGAEVVTEGERSFRVDDSAAWAPRGRFLTSPLCFTLQENTFLGALAQTCAGEDVEENRVGGVSDSRRQISISLAAQWFQLLRPRSTPKDY